MEFITGGKPDFKNVSFTPMWVYRTNLRSKGWTVEFFQWLGSRLWSLWGGKGVVPKSNWNSSHWTGGEQSMAELFCMVLLSEMYLNFCKCLEDLMESWTRKILNNYFLFYMYIHTSTRICICGSRIKIHTFSDLATNLETNVSTYREDRKITNKTRNEI